MLNELIGAVSGGFLFVVVQHEFVAIEYGDIGASWCWCSMDLDDTYADFAYVGQVYEVFCMGGLVDRACAQHEGS